MSLHYERVEAKIGFGREKEMKYVGRRRLQDPFTLERLAKEVSHITGLSQATAEIVFRYMIQAVEDAIQDGRSVDLGIGKLSPTITTRAAADEAEVKVVRKRVLFRASKHLRSVVENMSVHLIGEEDAELVDDDELTPDETVSPDPSSGNGSSNDTGGNTGGGNGQN